VAPLSPGDQPMLPGRKQRTCGWPSSQVGQTMVRPARLGSVIRASSGTSTHSPRSARDSDRHARSNRRPTAPDHPRRSSSVPSCWRVAQTRRAAERQHICRRGRGRAPVAQRPRRRSAERQRRRTCESKRALLRLPALLSGNLLLRVLPGLVLSKKRAKKFAVCARFMAQLSPPRRLPARGHGTKLQPQLPVRPTETLLRYRSSLRSRRSPAARLSDGKMLS